MTRTKAHRIAIISGVIASLLLVTLLRLEPQTVPTTWTRREVDQTAFGRNQGHLTSLQDDIRNETLGFQKIFAINLPHRTDHKDALTLASHFTGMHIEFADGVYKVDSKSYPPFEDYTLSNGTNPLLAWRAHMNVMREIVDQGISTALIFEDDVDWDMRIKDQLQTFAKASRHLLHPRTLADHETVQDLDLDGKRWTIGDGSFGPARKAVQSRSSPYGDVKQWDLLWLGHCGSDFPPTTENIPQTRIVNLEDDSVPVTLDVESGSFDIVRNYPAKTRVVSRAWGTTCSIAYAVTLPMARRILYELGVWKVTGPYDMMLRSMCHGSENRRMRTCLAPQPALMNRHLRRGPKKALSDLEDYSEGYVETAFTPNIVLSTRVNLPKFVEGETSYIRSFRP